MFLLGGVFGVGDGVIDGLEGAGVCEKFIEFFLEVSNFSLVLMCEVLDGDAVELVELLDEFDGWVLLEL